MAEKYIIKKTKHVLTYIIAIVLIVDIIMIIFPGFLPIVRYINYGLFYSTAGILLLIYLYLFRKTSGKLRRNALLTILGLAICALASLLETDYLISEGIVQPYYSPILFSIGASILAYGQRQI